MTERLSIVTDEISQDLGEVREFLDEHRVGAVELRTISGRRVPVVTREDFDTLRAWARDRETEVLAVSPGLFKCRHDDHDELDRHLNDVLPRSIDLALDLGAELLISFTCEMSGEYVDPHAVSALMSAADACGAAELLLLVENEPGHWACTGRDLADMVRAAKSIRDLHVNWDPTNGNQFSEPELSDALRLVFPHVRHVHVKNGRLAPGERFARCGPLREGEIDWTAHLRLLKELGYEGYLGVETHFEPFREGSEIVLRELREMCEEVGFWR